MVRDFDVRGFICSVEEPDGEAETPFREPQPEHFRKVGTGMLPQDLVEPFLVQRECVSVIPDSVGDLPFFPDSGK